MLEDLIAAAGHERLDVHFIEFGTDCRRVGGECRSVRRLIAEMAPEPEPHVVGHLVNKGLARRKDERAGDRRKASREHRRDARLARTGRQLQQCRLPERRSFGQVRIRAQVGDDGFDGALLMLVERRLRSRIPEFVLLKPTQRAAEQGGVDGRGNSTSMDVRGSPMRSLIPHPGILARSARPSRGWVAPILDVDKRTGGGPAHIRGPELADYT